MALEVAQAEAIGRADLPPRTSPASRLTPKNHRLMALEFHMWVSDEVASLKDRIMALKDEQCSLLLPAYLAPKGERLEPSEAARMGQIGIDLSQLEPDLRIFERYLQSLRENLGHLKADDPACRLLWEWYRLELRGIHRYRY
jgi:hypothetical protein